MVVTIGFLAVETLVDKRVRPSSSGADRPDSRAGFAPFGSDELPDELVVQVLDLHRRIRACAILSGSVSRSGYASTQPAPSLCRTHDALSYISTAWDSTVRALSTPAMSVHATELTALINRLRALESQIYRYWSSAEAEAESRAVDAIGNLYRCKSLDSVIHRIPVEVAGLGFDRVVFSSANGSTWVPRAAHCPTDPMWSQRYLSGLQDAYEVPVAAARLQSVQVDNRNIVHLKADDRAFELWRRSRSKRFWMIPLSDRGRLMGILHVDCLGDGDGPSRPQFSALRTLGNAVPAIIGHSLRDVTVSDRTTRIETAGTEEAADGNTRAEVQSRADATELSARELDVIALMAEGKTNAQIGRRLVITEGTVKSHVKRILKKTESANRAEAVVKWMKGKPQPSAA